MAFEAAAPWFGRTDPEEGDLAIRWHHQVSLTPTGDPSTNVGLIGFASDAGVKRNKGRPGAAAGPAAIRRQLANFAWHEQPGLKVTDFGTVSVDDEQLEVGQQTLAEHIARALPQVRRLLVMGGGHETAWGSFSGLSKVYAPASHRIGIINLDAHFDLRKTGPQGPSSGTPFAQIADAVGKDGFHYCCLGVARSSNIPSLFATADELGVSYREDHAMTVSDLPDIRRQLQSFCQGLDLVYLTIDLDVLPHYQAPGVSAPAAQGVSLEVVQAILKEVDGLARQLPLGMPLVEISELNPETDHSGVTARTAALLADTLLCPTRRC